MTGLVIDASVVIKLLIDEAHSDRARALFSDALQVGDSLFAPPLMPAEVTNVLFQRTRRQQNTMSARQADDALAFFLRFPILLETPPSLYIHALGLARTHSLRATYDALYVALAEILGVELWTADERLVQSVGAAAPWVRWIGDYPLPSGTG